MPRCRFCESPLTHTFVDLGMSPLCESFLTREQLNHHHGFRVDVWAGHAEGVHWPCPECGSELS